MAFTKVCSLSDVWQGEMEAFDVEGTELWARDIQESYGPVGLNWVYASSPLLHDSALYVQVLHGMRTTALITANTPTSCTRWTARHRPCASTDT